MKIRALIAMLAWLASAQAWAGTSSCSATATAVSFGTYDPTSPSDVKPTGSISVSCQLISGISFLVGYTITLSTGSGSYTARKMIGTTTPLAYNLYMDGGFTQVWGDGVSSGTFSKTDGYLLGVGTIVLSYNVFGKMPAQQLVAAGGYSDNIVVSISY